MGTCMIGNRMWGLALPVAFAIFGFAAPAIAAQFDGRWNMAVVTTNGHCGKIKVGLAISGSRIRSTRGSFALHRIHVDGFIADAAGQTRMTAVAGPRVARWSGRFTRSQGSGMWNGTGSSCVCSGVWSAVRS